MSSSLQELAVMEKSDFKQIPDYGLYLKILKCKEIFPKGSIPSGIDPCEKMIKEYKNQCERYDSKISPCGHRSRE